MNAEKILVVDDDTNICELLRLYLEKDGFSTIVADDGNKAVELNAKHSPDLILLDGGKSDDSTDLQLYDFSIMSATQSNVTEQAIYDIAFVLGTTRGGININSTNNYCQKNSDAIKNEDYAEAYANNSVNYCSVNRFEFVARQTGGK